MYFMVGRVVWGRVGEPDVSGETASEIVMASVYLYPLRGSFEELMCDSRMTYDSRAAI